MPKRRPSSMSEPLDIFTNPRLTNAMAAATGLAELPPAAEPERPESEVPEAPEARPERGLRSVPAAPEEEVQAEVQEPEAAAQAPPKEAPKEAPKERKGRAEAPPEPEIPELPEPNVPLKFRVPQTLRSEFQTFKAELSAALGGVALDDSNLGRPLLEYFLLEQRERILEAAAGFKGKLRRPANGDAVGMAEFDHALGEIFGEARKRRRSTSAAGER